MGIGSAGFALSAAVVFGAVACGSSTTGGGPLPDGGGTAGQGGSSATAGDSAAGGTAGGTGGVPAGPAERIDVLLMVDNSASMTDKQELLGNAIPALVARLVNPICVDRDAQGNVTAMYPAPADPSAACTQGEREFGAAKDVHVGVVSSSLGGHGADSCSPAQGGSFLETMDDGGRLLQRGPSGDVATYSNLGFLQWDPDQKKSPPGTSDPNQLGNDARDLVRGAGQSGCGFESSLEAWYRFLIDPDPYQSITRSPCFDGDATNGCAEATGTDAALLQQRRDFLRPDSLVVVAVLSDENDCSVIDGGQYFISLQASQGAQPFLLPRGTAACAADPNNACCYSCGQPPPAGCPNPDPECDSKGMFYTSAERGDQLNLRCFHQKQRFGIDFLQPTSRYVNGLSDLQVPDRTSSLVPNPLYSDLSGGSAPPRHPGRVFFAAIVGVPWQDLATAGSLGDPGKLRYRTAAELEQDGRWDVILGDASNGILPTDPLMIESVDQRSGANPVTSSPLVPTGAVGTVAPDANPINGHEWNIADRDDLQYACIFELPTPRECNGAYTSCDCANGVDTSQKPLCQAPGSTTYGTTQYYAKAFPGVRHLEVARRMGSNAIVTSICPKESKDGASEAYGYRPVADAIVRAIGGQL